MKRNKKVKYAYLIHESNIPKVKITFPFSYENLDQVKSLPMRKYVPDGKWWKAPLDLETLELLLEWNWTLDEGLWEYFKSQKEKSNTLTEVEINNLKGELFNYQKQGVSFLEKRNGRAIIADEMGLGKTAQALAYLANHPDTRPAIIICPATIKLNWAREIEKWMDTSEYITILSGQTPYKFDGDIIIINYDILPYWIEELMNFKPEIIIADECHFFKNNKANRTKAVKRLAKKTTKFIALSGTPITSRPIEFYNAIKVIEPLMFPNYMHYAERYCDAKHNGFGWDFSGASNIAELHDKLNNRIMIRRLKKDVLKDLPDKIRSFVPIEINNRKEYNNAELEFETFATNVNKSSKLEIQNKTEALRQIAIDGKMTQAIQWIKDFLEIGEKLVVFAWHKKVIKQLMEEFKDIAVKVDGSVTGTERQTAIDRFQSDRDVQLFVGNIKAAGVGITLTAASNVAFVELPWTSGELDQAEDRCHRIGQKDTVNVHYLLAENTIDEHIAKMIDEKRKVVDGVLDGKQTDSESLLIELINQYSN